MLVVLLSEEHPSTLQPVTLGYQSLLFFCKILAFSLSLKVHALQASSSEHSEASTSSHPRQDHQNNYQPAFPSRRPRYEGPKSERSNNSGHRSEQPKRRTDFILQRMEAKRPSRKGAERVQNFPYKRGDPVMGTVIGGTNGWRVALDYDQELLG